MSIFTNDITNPRRNRSMRLIDPVSLGLGGASIFGNLLGLFGGGPNADELGQQAQSQFGEEALARRQKVLFQLLASSPAFQRSLGQINLQGQQLGGNITASLARRGLLETGVGATGAALGQAAGGFARSGAIADLSSTATTEAGKINALLAQLFGQFQGQQLGQPSTQQRIGGAISGAAGAGLAQHLGRNPVIGSGQSSGLDRFFTQGSRPGAG